MLKSSLLNNVRVFRQRYIDYSKRLASNARGNACVCTNSWIDQEVSKAPSPSKKTQLIYTEQALSNAGKRTHEMEDVATGRLLLAYRTARCLFGIRTTKQLFRFLFLFFRKGINLLC